MSKKKEQDNEKLLTELVDRDAIRKLAQVFNPLSVKDMYEKSSGRLAEALTMASASFEVMGSMFEGVAMSKKFGAGVLAPVVGRLWGCVHHGELQQCKEGHLDNCMIEHLCICQYYKPDLDKPLFLDTDNSTGMVTGCLYCGKPFSKPHSKENLSDLFCNKCKDRLINLMQLKMKALVEYMVQNNQNLKLTEGRSID